MVNLFGVLYCFVVYCQPFIMLQKAIYQLSSVASITHISKRSIWRRGPSLCATINKILFVVNIRQTRILLGMQYITPFCGLQKISELTPLTPEVISRQATINIGTIGHVAHGKSTVVKAISGVQVGSGSNRMSYQIQCCL